MVRATVAHCRRGDMQRGMTLVEMLVAVALGLGVVAAVVSSELAASRSTRLLAAQLQMAEDAQIGLQLLSSELMMAGYARPSEVTVAEGGELRWQLPLAEPPLWACDSGFASPSTQGALACAPAGTSAALAVRYQADEHNTVPLSGTTRPADCLGAGLQAANGLYLTENRWYVASSQGRSELRCASRLGNPGQPLVDNVESLALWFAEALATDLSLPVRHVRASQVTDFTRVRSVRLCLLMRSTDPVLAAGAPTDYLDCEGQARSSADRRLRRAFHTTVALRNFTP